MIEDAKNYIRSLVISMPRFYAFIRRCDIFLKFLLKCPHEDDFVVFSNFNGRKGLFVDIGANLGQSAISFRTFNLTFDILSFEPDKFLEADLAFCKKLIGRKFDYRMIGLSDVTSVSTLYIPIIGRTLLTQAASLSKGAVEARNDIIKKRAGKDFEVSEFKVELKRFDDLGLTPDIAKIDVEGLELQVLLGMESTIRAHAPLFLIENSVSAKDVVPHLKDRGYLIFRFENKTNVLYEVLEVGSARNYFAIPKSRIDELRGFFQTTIRTITVD